MFIPNINNDDFKLIFHAKHIKIEFAITCIHDLQKKTSHA
jgi:hypothetical protein